MTDITVRHDLSSGAAAIEIRGAETSETRFRLRDPYTEKYLTKRGWTKNAAFLPGEASIADGVMTIAVGAELARKITPGTNLVLDQPSTDFQEVLTWPLPIAGSVLDEPAAAIADAHETVPAETVPAEIPAIDTPGEEPTAAEPEAAKLEAPELKATEPLLIESFEPAVMHDDLREEKKPEAATFLAGNDNRPSNWKPTAIAAAICLLVGAGVGYAVSGPGETAAIKQARQAAARQLETQKREFDRQVKEATVKASNADLASLTSKVDALTADRDEARKALADKEKSVAALEKQLSDANTQIEAVKNAAGDKAKAQITALDKTLQDTQAKLADANDQLAARERDLKAAQAKLDTANSEAAKSQTTAQNTALTEKLDGLNTQLKQSEQQLSQRDATLRDVQAKLSVANIQIDALKVIANKTTEAGLEKTAMSEKLARLTSELDKTSQALSDREQALTDATARLRDTEAKLAAANKRNDELVADAGQNPDQRQPQAASDETPDRLQEERDLYAKELKNLTTSFSILKSEKSDLEKTVADLKAQVKGGTQTASLGPSKAIWGATAIDQTGAIYSLQNQISQKVAQENVTAICRGKSGSRCEALATYSNACLSVARFQGEQPAADNYAYFVHRDWKTASRTALERCESMGMSCTVRFTACSPDALSKPISE